ncbi:hypothetical protein F5Y17DRAFT_379394 [Xylariaceae sp. FL0594]|nr:hypothetical protein F5Y17DRAFT_379394 [Xylariaceae sp. FL0594]
MDEHHLSLTSADSSDMARHNISLDFGQHADLVACLPETVNFDDIRPPAAAKDPITRWYHMNDGPWHPLASGATLTSGADNRDGQPVIPDLRALGGEQFLAPARRMIQPLEFIPHSDSGYGSTRYHHRPSIIGGSICDDSFETNPDAQSVMGVSMVDTAFSVHDAVPSSAMSSDTLLRSWNPQSIRLETSTLRCETCKAPLRTKSEQTKHHRRHTKPYKCDVENCPRKVEGFSTTNDLDRHKRSVHPESDATGDRYVCHLGQCINKEKLWPRADNFKAHLKRMHKLESVSDTALERYIYNGPPLADGIHEGSVHGAVLDGNEPASVSVSCHWPQLFNDTESSGHLSQVQPDHNLDLPAFQQELSDLDNSSNKPGHDAYQEIITPCTASDDAVTSLSPSIQIRRPGEAELGELGSVSREDPAAGLLDGAQAAEADDEPYDAPDRSLIALPIDSQMQNLALTSATPDILSPIVDDPPDDASTRFESIIKLDLNTLDASSIRQLVNDLESRGLLEQHGYKRDSAQRMHAEAAVEKASFQYPCSTCEKAFRRRCELRKHEKRHEKPYGCTEPSCDKKFGSKNDWKRHENSKHYMREKWRCAEKKDKNCSDVCEKVCYRREHFESHLSEEHQITDPRTLEDKLKKCRVGRNGEERYWCGFCQKIVEVKQRGEKASSERFDHIGEHYAGRSDQAPKDITEWKHFGASQPHNEPSTESSNDGSDDGSQPLGSTNASEAGQDRQRAAHGSTSLSKSKRKRNRGPSNTVATNKRSKLELQGMICCNCGDLITMAQCQCCNYGCGHIPCGDCTSTFKG